MKLQKKLKTIVSLKILRDTPSKCTPGSIPTNQTFSRVPQKQAVRKHRRMTLLPKYWRKN